MENYDRVTNRLNAKFYYLNNKKHRTDGPAVEYYDGTKLYYLNGKLHRTDGPACEWANGHKEWFLNGIAVSEEQFLQQTQQFTAPEAQKQDLSRWNTKCHCGANAYDSGFSVECERGCS